MKPIDVWLLTGYLGAGKTTLLNRLLKLPRFAESKIALVINEFGDLGVDAAKLGPDRPRTFEINKGSVLCVCTKTDFLKVLSQLADEIQPDAVLIEATGVAAPADLTGYLDQPGLAGRFNLRADICLVDAAGFTKVAAYLKSAVDQAAGADAIVINKADRAGEPQLDQLRKVLAEMNPDAPTCAVCHGQINPSFLDKLHHRPTGQKAAAGPPMDIRSETFATDKTVSRDRFDAALESLGDRLLRLKGHVRFEDGLRFVECVGPDRSESDPLPETDGTTAFTAISYKAPPNELLEHFNACWED